MLFLMGKNNSKSHSEEKTKRVDHSEVFKFNSVACITHRDSINATSQSTNENNDNNHASERKPQKPKPAMSSGKERLA